VTGTLAAAAPTIATPHIEYGLLSPMLLVFGVAVAGVLVEAFVPRAARRPIHLALSLGGLAGAFILTIVVAATSSIFHNGSPGHIAAMGAVAVDRPTLFIQGTILVLAFISVLLIAESSHDISPFAAQAAAVPGSAEEREGLLAGIVHTEVYPLVLFAVGGMLLFPASNDLLTMFVALEVLSLPLYLLCGLARRRRLLSQEAAMKYFLLGAFSSAFFLFGVAMLYGFAGSVQLAAIAKAASSNTSGLTLLYAGIALVGLGLFFKIGAVPFQSWKPDVYQGAPTPVTALMASCTLVSAFGALLRVFYVAFGQLSWSWRPAMIGIAILTMLVGSIVAITQTDVKRLLDRTGRIRTHWSGRSEHGRPVQQHVLPGCVWSGGRRRVRRGDAGPRPGGRGGAPVPLGRAGQALPAGCRDLRVLPDHVRRYPAHQRFHRKVRRLPGGDPRRCAVPGHHRRAEQRDPGLPLRPGDRADVLQRAGAGWPGGGAAQRLHRGGRGGRSCGDAGAGHRSRAAAQPRQPRGDTTFCPLIRFLPGSSPIPPSSAGVSLVFAQSAAGIPRITLPCTYRGGALVLAR
jgi:hypothetical protein